MTATYLDAIRKFEGFTQKAEWDYAQFTNGYGTKAKYAGEVIDKTEADRRFQAEVADARAIVERHAPNVDEGTKAALTSLTYNAGDKWAKSGLGEAVRSGDTERARELFLQYNKAGGEVLPGLVQRRLAEAAWIGQSTGDAGGAAGAAAAMMQTADAGNRFAPMPMIRTADFAANAPPATTPPLATESAAADAPVKDEATRAAEEEALMANIKTIVSGRGDGARLTHLLLASKLIGAPSAANHKDDKASGSVAV